MSTSTARHAREETTERPPAPGLSPRADKAIRRAAFATVLLLSLFAAVLSYTNLRHLALHAGLGSVTASIFPIVVDGLELVGALGVVHAGLNALPVWYPWLLMLLGVGASVIGNVAASATKDTLSEGVHGAPPIVLALSLEAMMRIYRHQARRRMVASVAVEADAPPPVSAWDATPPAAPATPVLAAAAATEAVAVPARPARMPVTVSGREEPAAKPNAPSAPAVSVLADKGQPVQAGAAKTTRDRICDLLRAEPELRHRPSEVAKRLGSDPSYTRKLVKDIKAELFPAEPVA